MNDDLNDFSDNDFESPFEDILEYTFSPEMMPEIMERMKGISTFFDAHSVQDLMDKFQKFQQVGLDGKYILSTKIIEKFSDYLVSDTLNELVAKNLLDYFWSDEYNDFVFSAK